MDFAADGNDRTFRGTQVLVPVSRTRPRFAPVLIAVGLGALIPQTAAAICPPTDLAAFCVPGVVGDGPRLIQGDVDTDAAVLSSDAWVLDGTTTITLPAGGAYTPGTPAALGAPTIFVTENATLSLVGLGAPGVDLDANIILCDSGTLEVEDSALRFGSSTPIVFAAEDSRIEYAGATLSGVGAADVAHALGGTASLVATPTAAPSIQAPGGSVSVLLSGASTANIDGAMAVVALRLNAGASATVSDSSFLSLGVEACDGDLFGLDAPPSACDLSGECFGAGHPQIDFVRAAPYALDVSNSQVYAWDVLTQPGATVDLANIPTDANLSVTIAGDLGMASMGFPAGADPVGVEDRTIDLTNAEVLAWSVDAESGSDVTIEPGSELGSMNCRGDASCRLENTTVTFGPLANRDDAMMVLVDSVVQGAFLSAGASLESASSSYEGSFIVVAPTWLADGDAAETIAVQDEGVLHEVELTDPAGPLVVDPGDVIAVRGSLSARDDAGALAEFPPATLEVYDEAGETLTELASITSAVDDDVLHSWDTTDLVPGTYELRLRFVDSSEAVSRRAVTVAGGEGSSSTGEGSTGVATGSSSGADTTTGDESDTGADTTGGDTGADTTGDGSSGDPSTTDTPDPTAGGETGGGESTSGDPEADASAGGCRVGGSPASLALLFVVGVGLRRRASTARSRRGR